MPIPLVIGAVVVGVGAAAAVSYLGPLIIACIVGAFTTISAFFIGKAYYENTDSKELSETDKELKSREQMTREEALRTAEQIAININRILRRSEEQQHQLGQSIQRFNHSIEESHEINDQLDIVASSIYEAVNSSTRKVESLSIELEQLKKELILANTELKNTQDALAETNNEIKQTIEKLAASEASIANDISTSKESISGFTNALSVAQELLHQNIEFNSLQDAELTAIQAINTEMPFAIRRLETTIETLSRRFIDLNDVNQSQFTEIQALLAENIRLRDMINGHSQDTNEQDSYDPSNQPPSKGHQMGLFK